METETATSSSQFSRRFIRVLYYIIFIFLTGSIVWTVLYSFLPVPLTPLMVLRTWEKPPRPNTPPIRSWKKVWVPISGISPYLQKAVVAAEDQKFYNHSGFDFEAIEEAMKHNEKRPKNKRGASTISQQTAKNVFLWPYRNWLRKGLESYFTILMELLWSKQRILEVYLNVVELGPGVYGAEAAAREYFNKSASQLTEAEAALIAAVLPNPRKMRLAQPTEYMRMRQNKILGILHGRSGSLATLQGEQNDEQKPGQAANTHQDSENATESQILDERSGEPLSDTGADIGEDHEE